MAGSGTFLTNSVCPPRKAYKTESHQFDYDNWSLDWVLSVILGIWSSSVGYFLTLFCLTIGVACIWASYRLPVNRVYNMRLSGVALTLIGLYFLVLVLGSSEAPPPIPGR